MKKKKRLSKGTRIYIRRQKMLIRQNFPPEAQEEKIKELVVRFKK